MVMSNIGTIVMGVPVSSGTRSSPDSGPSISDASSTTPTQVRLISLSNTLSRLIIGPLADHLAPVGVLSTTAAGAAHLHFPRHRRFSRLLFPLLAALVMALSYLWMAAGVRTQQDIYAVAVSTGAAYGAAFTVLPSVVAALWRGKNAGRNYGLITYAPFVGTPVFSYLYAFGAAQHQDGDGMCQGVRCWRGTFAISAAAMVLTFTLLVILWRRARTVV